MPFLSSPFCRSSIRKDYTEEGAQLGGHVTLSNRLEQSTVLRFARHFWQGVDEPQYRYVTRPINRLLGGPSQPLASSLGAALAADYLLHQMPVRLIGHALEHLFLPINAPKLYSPLGVEPWKDVSAFWGVVAGVPVALHKLAGLRRYIALREVINACMSRNRQLQIALVDLLLRAATEPRNVVIWCSKHCHAFAPQTAFMFVAMPLAAQWQFAEDLLAVARGTLTPESQRRLERHRRLRPETRLEYVRDLALFCPALVVARDIATLSAIVGVIACAPMRSILGDLQEMTSL